MSHSFHSPGDVYDGANLDSCDDVYIWGTGTSDVGLEKIESNINGVGWIIEWTRCGGCSLESSMSVDWSKTVNLTSGTNTISVRLTDHNNQVFTQTITVCCETAITCTTTTTTTVVGDSPPWIEVSSPEDGSTFDTAAITFCGSAGDDIRIRRVETKINDGSWVEQWQCDYCDPETVINFGCVPASLIEGENTILIRAHDFTGQVTTVTLTVYRSAESPEDDPPQVIITNPTDGHNLIQAHHNYCGWAYDDVGLKKVESSINGGSWVEQWDWGGTPGQTEINWGCPSHTFSVGANTISIKATDTDDQTYTKTITVYWGVPTTTTTVVGDSPPWIEVSSPASGSTVSDTAILFCGTAGDDIEITKLETSVNDGPWVKQWDRCSICSVETEINWGCVSASLNVGSNIIMIRAHDSAGQTSITSININRETPLVGDQPPLVLIRNPQDGHVAVVQHHNYCGWAYDDIGLKKIESSINEGSWIEQWNWRGTLGQTEIWWGCPTTWFNEGENTISVRATDTSDQQYIETITIYLDTDGAQDDGADDEQENEEEVIINHPPQVNIITPLDNAIVNNPVISLSGNANDDFEIIQVDYRINSEIWVNYWTKCENCVIKNTIDFTFDVTSLNPDWNFIEIKVTDSGGITSSSRINIFLSTEEEIQNEITAVNVDFPTDNMAIEQNNELRARAIIQFIGSSNIEISGIWYIDTTQLQSFTTVIDNQGGSIIESPSIPTDIVGETHKIYLKIFSPNEYLSNLVYYKVISGSNGEDDDINGNGNTSGNGDTSDGDQTILYLYVGNSNLLDISTYPDSGTGTILTTITTRHYKEIFYYISYEVPNNEKNLENVGLYPFNDQEFFGLRVSDSYTTNNIIEFSRQLPPGQYLSLNNIYLEKGDWVKVSADRSENDATKWFSMFFYGFNALDMFLALTPYPSIASDMYLSAFINDAPSIRELFTKFTDFIIQKYTTYLEPTMTSEIITQVYASDGNFDSIRMLNDIVEFISDVKNLEYILGNILEFSDSIIIEIIGKWVPGASLAWELGNWVFMIYDALTAPVYESVMISCVYQEG